MQARHGRGFWYLVVALAVISVGACASGGEEPPSEDAVAVVNGTVITRVEFDREMSRVQQDLLRRGASLDSTQLSAIQQDILEDLIDRALLYQESQREGVEVDETLIDEQLGTLKGRFPTEAQFEKALSQMNLSEAALRSQFKRGMAIEQLIDRELAQEVRISGEEAQAYYTNHPELFKQPAQVRASHILIQVDAEATASQKAEARKKLKEIQLRLEKGEDFGALAKDFSECPSGTKGGDLGYFGRGQMMKPFEEAAFALKPDEVSDIVETQVGYHLIKAIDQKPETTVAYEDVKDRLAEYLKRERIQREVERYVEKLKQEAKVERWMQEKTP